MRVRRIRYKRWLVAGLAFGALAAPAAAQARFASQSEGNVASSAQKYLIEQQYGAPDGWVPYVESLTAAGSAGSIVDGRSPDTKDFAQAAQLSGTGLDLRSPDTRDAAVLAHSPVVTVVQSHGFHWGDAGIGIAAGMALFLALMLIGSRRRPKPGRVVTA